MSCASDDISRNYVECSACKIWRVLPKSIDVDSLPDDNWVCGKATWCYGDCNCSTTQAMYVAMCSAPLSPLASEESSGGGDNVFEEEQAAAPPALYIRVQGDQGKAFLCYAPSSNPARAGSAIKGQEFWILLNGVSTTFDTTYSNPTAGSQLGTPSITFSANDKPGCSSGVGRNASIECTSQALTRNGELKSSPVRPVKLMKARDTAKGLDAVNPVHTCIHTRGAMEAPAGLWTFTITAADGSVIDTITHGFRSRPRSSYAIARAKAKKQNKPCSARATASAVMQE